jgi:hypothetical protein
MFYLRESYLKAYRLKVDSLDSVHKKENENLCIVHLKSYCYKWENSAIYFNDSLVGYCHGATRKKGGFNIYSLDFKFTCSGVLTHQIKKDFFRSGLILEQGKEYYINILPTKRGDIFQGVNKYDF